MSLAAITLVTGLPGAGKTLNTLKDVRDVAEAENVPVYYSGIADLRVPGWTELEDASKWHELPPKSICIVDEAQRVFRPRHTSSSVPEHVAKLETIRHQGIRLVVITQHPKLLDANVRRLVGKHRHYVRVFGSKVVTRHEWEECKPDPDLSRSDSIRTTVAHPTEVYGWYKSAEVHTVKRKIPLRFVLALGIPLVVVVLGWFAVQNVRDLGRSDRIAKAVGVGQEAPGSTNAAGKGGSSTRPASGAPAAPMTASEYVAAHQPRIAGLAYTAPIYDELTKPKAAPFPAGCVLGAGSEVHATRSSCRCYTDQGTRLDVPADLCLSIVDRGYFQSWRAPSSPGGTTPQAAAPARTPANLPSASPLPVAG